MDAGAAGAVACRRGARCGSFALGGLVGAAGALATVAPAAARRRPCAAGGLAAFEDAPCFLEAQPDARGTSRAAGELD